MVSSPRTREMLILFCALVTARKASTNLDGLIPALPVHPGLKRLALELLVSQFGGFEATQLTSTT